MTKKFVADKIKCKTSVSFLKEKKEFHRSQVLNTADVKDAKNVDEKQEKMSLK